MKNRLNESRLCSLLQGIFEGACDKLQPFLADVPASEYFITSTGGKEVNLCQKTNRNHKDRSGVSQPYRIIGILWFEKSETPSGIYYQIPWHLINW